MHNSNLSRSRGLVWFRSDLRLLDNQALTDAVAVCDEILPVFIFDERLYEGQTVFGFDKVAEPRRRFIMESVLELQEMLRSKNSDLFVAYGKTEEILLSLAHQYKTSWVFCNRERTKEEVEIQDAVERNLWSIGQEMRYSRGKMLLHTADLPFPVTHTPDRFTIFKKEVSYIPIRKPLDVPDEWRTFQVDQFPLNLPKILHLDRDETTSLCGGEQEAQKKLNEVIDRLQTDDCQVMTNLSPYISLGCLSVKDIYHRLRESKGRTNAETIETLASRLLRRDYFRFMGKKYGDRIFYPSGVRDQILRYDIDKDVALRWANSLTDVPIIDAANRALKNTGRLSYRLRAVSAAFLVQELKQDWRFGAEFFESHLIDYDPCSNYGNWNQIAGVGPEERDDVYANLENQTKIIDPEGDFVRQWA